MRKGRNSQKSGFSNLLLRLIVITVIAPLALNRWVSDARAKLAAEKAKMAQQHLETVANEPNERH